MKGWKFAVRIILECTLMACGLGIALDMVTAHIAVEYFIVYHVHIVDSDSPIVMALVWGVYAAYWFGAIAGMLLVIVNSTRPTPLPISIIRRMMLKACVSLWGILMVILVGSYAVIGLAPPSRGSDFEANRRLVAVAITHSTEYVLGAVVTLITAYFVWRHPAPATSAAKETD
jgi:hypothetical protein